MHTTPPHIVSSYLEQARIVGSPSSVQFRHLWHTPSRSCCLPERNQPAAHARYPTHCVSQYPPHPARYVSKLHAGTEQNAHVLGPRSVPEQLLGRYWIPAWHASGPIQV